MTATLQPCDRTGNFKADILEYGLRTSDKSESVGVFMRAQLLEWWDGDDWIPWREYDMEGEGTIWIVNKKGEVLDKNVKSLVDNAGWDGTIESVNDKTWQPIPVQVVIQAEEYNGKTSMRISFLDPHDRTPGGQGVVSPEKAKELANRFGSQLRALTGNVRRNPAPPADKPTAPTAPKPGASTPPASKSSPAAPPRGAKVPADEIPF